MPGLTPHETYLFLAVAGTVLVGGVFAAIVGLGLAYLWGVSVKEK